MSTEVIIAAIAFLALLGGTFTYLLGRFDRHPTHNELRASIEAINSRLVSMHDSIHDLRNLIMKMAITNRGASAAD